MPAVSVTAGVDDGYRNTVEFLRARLRIGAGEAKRRLGLARGLLPRPGLTGIPQPAAHPELGAAVAAGDIASRSASIITAALDRVRHLCDEDTTARMEHTLTRTATEHDPDFLARVARGWTDAIDTDGAEPTEEVLQRFQGAFIRPPRHGLQHLEIYATPEQFEYLLTVMNTATNPRTTTPATPASAGARDGSGRTAQPPARPRSPGCPSWTSGPGRRSTSTAWSAPARSPSPPEACPPPADCAPRSWPPSTTATSSPASRT